jgi:hypothetical protein
MAEPITLGDKDQRAVQQLFKLISDAAREIAPEPADHR